MSHRSQGTEEASATGEGSKLLLARTGALVFLLATATGGQAAAVGGSWIPQASLVVPRQEIGAARVGNEVYVVGGLIGFFPPLQATNTVEVYDIAGDTWSPGPPLPVALDHMAVAALDGHVYVMGGFSADFQARDGVFVLAPGGASWNPAASLPAPRGAPWAVAHAGRIYLFGGVDAGGVAQTTTFVFAPQSGWSTAAAMPTSREHLNAVSLGEFIYVIGGRNGTISTNVNERYDPAANQWQTLAPMPTARSAAGAAALDGRIYVAGGEVPQLFAVNEAYDPATDTWEGAPPMPIPRHGVAAVALDDRILMPGGGTVQGLQPTNAVDAFRPLGVVPTLPGWGLGVVAVALVISASGVVRRRSRSGRSARAQTPRTNCRICFAARSPSSQAVVHSWKPESSEWPKRTFP